MTALEVTIELPGEGGIEKLPVNELESISYDDDPHQLTTARARLAKGEYAEAQLSLKDLSPEDKRPDIAADIEFFKALCAARLALGGSGAIVDAGRKMAAFAKKYPDSYHYLEACQLVADLLVADGRFDKAESYYDELAKAPWKTTRCAPRSAPAGPSWPRERRSRP